MISAKKKDMDMAMVTLRRVFLLRLRAMLRRYGYGLAAEQASQQQSQLGQKLEPDCQGADGKDRNSRRRRNKLDSDLFANNTVSEFIHSASSEGWRLLASQR